MFGYCVLFIHDLFFYSDIGPQRAALDIASELMSHNVELCPHSTVESDWPRGWTSVGGQSTSHCLVPDVHSS